MTERDFIYWLQGYLEVSGTKKISAEQVQIIKDHLSLVLNKVTPIYDQSIVTPLGPYLGGGGLFQTCQFGGRLGCNCSVCLPPMITC